MAKQGYHPHGKHDPYGLDQYDSSRLVLSTASPAEGKHSRLSGRQQNWLGRALQKRPTRLSKAYGPKKTGPLVQQLDNYDFSSIRAALIASVPSKKHVSDSSSEEDTLWGWPALKDLMSQIPIQQKSPSKKPHVVIQVRIHPQATISL